MSPVRSLPSRAVHCEGRDILTGIWTLSNDRTGRTVTLVGTMHVGTTEYYRELGDLLSKLASAGSLIHYEQIIRASPENVSPEEASILESIHAGGYPTMIAAIASMFGWARQKDELSYPEGSVNVDMRDVDLLRLLGAKRMAKLFPTETPSIEGDEQQATRKLIGFALRHIEWLHRLYGLTPTGRAVKRVVLDQRNDLALERAVPALKEADLAMVWGAAHLPGLAAGLMAHGFRPVAASWQTVGTT